jgi:G3E family GTPase
VTLPVTLVTGFLGAGKTTLINRLLQNELGLAIAAIVNDFGSINIDAALISENSDAVIGLNNGCICCSLQGDLLRTLKSVLSSDRAVDHIVIEASGVSDPQGIIEVLMDPVVREAVELDAIVTVVDVEALTDNPALYDDALWLAQFRAGDFIAVSKGDAARRDEVERRLHSMGKRVFFDGAEPPALAVLGTMPRAHKSDAERAVITQDRFVTLEWEWEGEVATAAFQAVIEKLSPVLVRAKGILNLSEMPGSSCNFNLVGRRASMTRLKSRQSSCQLVLIGERGRLDPEEARALLFRTFANLKLVVQNG